MKGTFEVKAGAPASGGAAAGGASAAAGTAKVTATDNKFDKKSLEGAVGKEFTVTLENKGKAKHNLAFYDKAGGKELAPGATSKIIDGGQSDTIKFIPPTAGKFYFQCDVHPDQMSGDFTVK
jgi:plastocyanin